MEIKRAGSQPSARGPADWFTGATATTAMTHIAIQEQLEGTMVEWMEQVSEGRYQAR